MILKVALRYGRSRNIPVLIEATCNQVNHEGGYTGMRPQDFVDQVARIAREEQFDSAHLILGGDHLGPNPWRKLNAHDAMNQAELMVRAFAEAGFNKFHLDASMRCADDPEVLDEDDIAQRAARLAKAIEEVCQNRSGSAPVYIIGTEVPPPGGANHALDRVLPTDPQSALNTIAKHRRVFHEAGLDDAFDRVVALVVQPGVEFGDVNVHQYKPENATGLAAVLESETSLCFEAHSTDYQSAASLDRLARDGYRIQKVGPWLSFALREALYGLDSIASELDPDYPRQALKAAMESLMQEHPEHWQDHYSGTEREQYLKRHYSYSDRIRYYWTYPKAEQAVSKLLETLSSHVIPETLISQYLPACWQRSMGNSLTAHVLIMDTIEMALMNYPTPKPVTSA
jgi:D-tagatose-1,6-bisphosphate aldolase subunit GatZ/KbaZ